MRKPLLILIIYWSKNKLLDVTELSHQNSPMILILFLIKIKQRLLTLAGLDLQAPDYVGCWPVFSGRLYPWPSCRQWLFRSPPAWAADRCWWGWSWCCRGTWRFGWSSSRSCQIASSECSSDWSFSPRRTCPVHWSFGTPFRYRKSSCT